jgi:hypothetical protein
MALNFDPTKKIKPPTSSVKIFEEPKDTKENLKETLEATPLSHQSNTNQTPLNQTIAKDLDFKEAESQSLKKSSVPVEPQTPKNNGVELVFKKEVIGVETVSKPAPISVGMVLEKFNGVELVSEVGSEQGLNTISSTPISHHLDTIVGREREFLFFVANQCQKNGSLTTPPLTIEKIKIVLNCSKDSIKTVVYRLTQKSILNRETRKMGRSGWVSFSLPKTIYDQILNQEDFRNGVGMVLKVGSEQGLKSAYSNNNSLKENNNTEPEVADFQVPENLKALGVGQKPLAVIVRDNILSHEEVQASLNHYSHDIAKNLVKVKSANFLFGCMRNKTPYISSSYAEAETRAITQEIARIKQLQAQKEELKELKLKEQYDQFLAQNPDFLEGLKKENQFLAKSPSGLLERMGFEKWREKNNT